MQSSHPQAGFLGLWSRQSIGERIWNSVAPKLLLLTEAPRLSVGSCHEAGKEMFWTDCYSPEAETQLFSPISISFTSWWTWNKKKWGIGHAFLYCQVTPAVQKSTDYMVVFKFSKKFLAWNQFWYRVECLIYPGLNLLLLSSLFFSWTMSKIKRVLYFIVNISKWIWDPLLQGHDMFFPKHLPPVCL